MTRSLRDIFEDCYGIAPRPAPREPWTRPVRAVVGLAVTVGVVWVVVAMAVGAL